MSPRCNLKLGAPDPGAVKKGEADFARYATVLDAHLAQRDYLVGAQLTLADISIATVLMYAREGQLPVQSYPAIVRWFKTIEKLDSWSRSAPMPAA